ncbi:MAG TPA: integrase [Ruminococcaceae bacterium]|nr:integrase [Lachnospiraceae bacterium]HBT64820.1 integrase [Oscillospiraceae bacterium]
MNDSILHELKEQITGVGEDTTQDDVFSYDGYQVVRREFFAHVYEPSITFNKCKISVNTACLKRLPNVDYVQILVNPEKKKLAIRASNEDEKDSFLWCTTRGEKRKPRQIICRMFFAKVIQLMGWNPDYRYKMIGKLIQSGGEYLFIFDLTATEIYQRFLSDGEKAKTSRIPVFPAEWQNQFGLPVEEHRRLLQVNIFDGYTVFGIKDNTVAAPADISE